MTHLTDKQLSQFKALYANHEELPYISKKRSFNKWYRQAVNNASKRVPKRHMIRTDEGLLPGDILLLWRISLHTFTTQSSFPKYFEFDYGINAPDHLKQLEEEGYIYQQTATESLEYLNMGNLRTILATKDVKAPSSLKRADLDELVLKHFSEEELAHYVDTRGFRLTDKGQTTLDNNPEPVDKHPKKS